MEVDLRPEVRQFVEGARGVDGQNARRVQAEEPDAVIGAAAVHVRAHVDLVKARQERDGRRQDRPHVAQGERDQADVGFAFERVDGQLRRDHLLQFVRGNLPVQEEQVMRQHFPEYATVPGPPRRQGTPREHPSASQGTSP